MRAIGGGDSGPKKGHGVVLPDGFTAVLEVELSESGILSSLSWIGRPGVGRVSRRPKSAVLLGRTRHSQG